MNSRGWQRVTSVHSPIVKETQKLHMKKGRADARHFLVEGEISVREALGGARVKRVLVRDDSIALADEFYEEFFPAGTLKAPEFVILTYEAMSRISTTDTPPRLAAALPMIDKTVTSFEAEAAKAAGASTGAGLSNAYVGCFNISDPGNVGTLIRSGDALGIGGILLSHGSVDPYNPKVVRSTMGSIFHLPFALGLSNERQIEFATKAGLKMVAAVATGGTPLHEADMRGPMFIMLGAETEGLPLGLQLKADLKVTIPIPGRAESFNVGVAGSVIMYEALRQRATG